MHVLLSTQNRPWNESSNMAVSPPLRELNRNCSQTMRPQRRLATAYVRVIITFLSCDSGRLLKVIAKAVRTAVECSQLAILERALKMDETAPNLHSSLAGPTFAARVGTVWTGTLLPLVSAIPQLNLEGLGLLY